MARLNADTHKSIYLTDEAVAALPYARGERGVYVVRDTGITGFRCIVNRNGRRLVSRASYARVASDTPCIDAWVIPST
jgi:hypothetical protein